MIGENTSSLQETEYGTLIMRSYDIEGNNIDAFYDDADDLVFVLDNTINPNKPNVLLVINPEGDKKWDEILSGEYNVDLETIRPKQDNKYQKLDIEYSGLAVYENLIKAYNAGDELEDSLNQLNILRDSAARHSAMTRLNVANETISKTNATIVKTKESIVRLQERLKTLRAKLSNAKKEIGRVNTKKSASQILRLESQIEATNEKLKRAKKRLESAQKRLEIATVDAELASNLLNQPSAEIKQYVKNKPLAVAQKYEVQTTDDIQDFDEKDTKPMQDTEKDSFDEEIAEENEDVVSDEDFDNDVKPLLSEDPNIVDDNIAFKPIDFNVAGIPEVSNDVLNTPSVLENNIDNTNKEMSRPVLESFTPLPQENHSADISLTNQETFEQSEKPELSYANFDLDKDADNNFADEQPEFTENAEMEEKTTFEVQEPEQNAVPIENVVRPVPPAPIDKPVVPVVQQYDGDVKSEKSTFVYYLLLIVLIVVSVFTLWLYQKKMGTMQPNGLLVEQVATQQEEPVKKEVVVEQQSNVAESVTAEPTEIGFLDEKTVVEPEPVVESVKAVAEKAEPKEPVIMGTVSEKISAFADVQEPDIEPEEQKPVVSEESVILRKPAYGTGAKYDDMFVYEEVAEEPDQQAGLVDVSESPVIYQGEYDDALVYDEEISDEEYTTEYPAVNYNAQDIGFYDDEFYDPEEAAYQAGDTGYDEY